MGGSSSFLGAPTSAELSTINGGRYQLYSNGVILWLREVGAHEIHGGIRNKFTELGSQAVVGYPTSDELPAWNGGRYQTFQNGMMLWHPSTNAYMVWHGIRQKFVAMGSEAVVGYPTSDELPAWNGGRYQTFQNRMILWHQNTGAYSLRGPIRDKFVEVGSEAALGYPKSEQSAWGTGFRQPFERAWIYWTPTSGAWVERPCVPGTPC
jgi:uncharacterized protein with LGFP repeats